MADLDISLDLAAALDPVVVFERTIGPADPWQKDALRADANQLFCCSRQVGKSAVVSVKAVHRAVYFPGSLVLCLSPSQRQSGELFDRIGGVYRDLGAPVPVVSESAVRVKLANGSRVLSLPASESTIRGYAAVDLALLDEAARIQDEVYTAVRPMLATSNGKLVGLSTPAGKRGWWYQAFVAEDRSWQRFKVTVNECPRISREFIEAERSSMPEHEFAAEYLCSFDENTTSAFGAGFIDAACNTGLKAFDIL